MSKHYICLTIDCDPDNLSGKSIDRNTLGWNGLEYLYSLPEILLENFSDFIPVTWFIRIDEQIKNELGNELYLFEKYTSFWEKTEKYKHEIAWHPHLYKKNSGGIYEIPTTQSEILDQLDRTWEQILDASLSFKAFRNGEGWLNEPLLERIKDWNFEVDSTALPGLFREDGHTMNWKEAPNEPYYPCNNDISKPCSQNNIVEFPMNTWIVKAPYDKNARLRYMNPAIHTPIFKSSLIGWSENLKNTPKQPFYFWVLILHPDELLPRNTSDLLYSWSISGLINNLKALNTTINQLGHTVEYLTLTDAAYTWKAKQEDATSNVSIK